MNNIYTYPIVAGLIFAFVISGYAGHWWDLKIFMGAGVAAYPLGFALQKWTGEKGSVVLYLLLATIPGAIAYWYYLA